MTEPPAVLTAMADTCTACGWPEPAMSLNSRTAAELSSTAIGLYALVHVNSRPRPASTSSPADWTSKNGNMLSGPVRSTLWVSLSL